MTQSKNAAQQAKDPEAGTPAQYHSARAQKSGTAELEPLASRSTAEEKSGKKRRLLYPPAPQPLETGIIDNHAHLDFRDGLVSPSVHEAMDAAEAVGVIGTITVGCNLEAARFTIEAIEAEPRLLGAVSIHPNDAARLSRNELDEQLEEIFELARHPRVRSVGETGLDYFRTGPEGAEQQKHSFHRHIEAAVELNKALQIHDRDAHDDVVEVLKEAKELPEHVVFHCFSGGAELAEICNENNWYMSFAGPLTFKANDELREAAKIAKPELLMVETDSPFLTPHPYRGRPNAPYMVPYTLQKLAELRQTPLEDMAAQVLDNTYRVYGQF